MSPIIFFILSLAMVFSLCCNPTPAKAQIPGTLSGEKRLEIIRVGVYENPPKVFTDDRGRAVGLFPDILNSIAEKEGWRLEFVSGTWQESLQRLEEKSIDIMVDVGFSKERAARYEFNNETVFINWGTLYTAKEFKADSFIDLNGRTIAVMKGSIHTDGEQGIKSILRQFDIVCHYIEVDDYKTVFELISRGEADAGVVNRIFGALNEDKYNFNASPVVFNPIDLKFAFPKNGQLTPLLVKRIDANLAELKNNRESIYHKVIAHYLSGLSGGVDMGGSDNLVKISLSPDEREWIKSHQFIRIGVDPGFAPFELMSESGNYMGMAADYVAIINDSLGIHMRPVKGLSWNETVEQAKQGKIDLLSCVGITQERKEHFIYSDPYLSFPRVIITGRNSPIESLEDLADKTVAVQVNSSHHDFIRKETIFEPVLYDTFQDAMVALSRSGYGTLRGDDSVKGVDAVIGNLGVATYAIQAMNLSNLKIAAHTSGEPNPLAFAVRRDWPVLVRLINRVLANMSESQKDQIARKWAPGAVRMASDVHSMLALSLKEKEFLKNHPRIRLGIDPALPPFEWQDDQGGYQGISSDYVELIEKRLGISMEVVPGLNLQQVEEGVAKRTIDIVPVLTGSPWRKRYLNFTRTYLSSPVVILTRQNSPFAGDVAVLAGKKVGVARGYPYQEFLQQHYPAIELKEAETVFDCLKELSMGVTNAYIGNLAVSSYLMQKHNIVNLKICGSADGPAMDNFVMGVRNDWPEMVSILDKALGSITQMERNGIADRWMSVMFEPAIDWSRVIRLGVTGGVISLVIIGFILFWNRRLATEIHARKKIELDLIKALDDADASRDAAERANSAKSIFLANMSHEIRTPMNAILGYSRLMQSDNTLSEDQRKSLMTINSSGEHLLNLINDILEMSKIEAGRMELNKNPFDLFALMEDMRLLFKERARSKGLVLEISPLSASFDSKDMPIDQAVPRYIETDESKLRQMLINLIGNAIKFTDQGYVRLTVRSEAKTGTIGKLQREAKSFLLFQVMDSGVGISKDDYETIFQSFEQTDMGRSKEGTGLGLAICRKYVQLMGGSLSVESEPGKGSVFTLLLPVVEVYKKDIPVKVKKRKVVGIKNFVLQGRGSDTDNDQCRILVVDDKDTNRDILTRQLVSIGISVRQAVDGKQALDIFHEWQPHMVMMDIRMPVMDGVEATKRIKSSERGDKTVVIVVSASAMEEERIEVMASGADLFIRKPFHETEIFDAIETLLGIEFIYEKEPLAADPSKRESSGDENDSGILRSSDLKELPESLLKEMLIAVEGGYIEKLKTCIETVARTDSGLADRLQELADNYEYEQLMGILVK